MAQQPTVETSASSLKALKLLGIDGSADKLTKNSSSTSLNVNPRRLSLNPEARLEIGLRASDGVTSSGSNSLAALNLPKKSEIKPIVDELKLDIHFVEDRPGSIQSGSAAALLKLFSVLICDPKLSNEGMAFVDDFLVSFGYFSNRLSVLRAITGTFRDCVSAEDGASKATRVFWALRKFIILERKAVREDTLCAQEIESFRQELSSGTDHTKSFATFLEKYLVEEEQVQASVTPRGPRKARRKSEPPKLESPAPQMLPSKASQLLGLGTSSSAPEPQGADKRKSVALTETPSMPSKASQLLGLTVGGTNAFESAAARPNSIAAMLDEKEPVFPAAGTKSRSHSGRAGSTESSQSDAPVATSSDLHPVLVFEPEDIAEQLMAIDFDLFKKTQISEYCSSAFSKDSPRTNAVAALVEQSNRLSRWIATAVLNPKIDKAIRAKMLSRLIKLMECLKTRNNFASMVTVFTTLESHAISRLKRTWKLVKRAKRDMLKRFAELLKPTSNFSGYRELLTQAELPCVPYIGITTKDLVSIEELPTYVGSPLTARSSPDTPTSPHVGETMASSSDSLQTPRSFDRVNWSKMQMISRVLNNQVVRFRTGTFFPASTRTDIVGELNLMENEHLVSKLVNFDEFNKLSDEIEPRATESSSNVGSPVGETTVLSFLSKRKTELGSSAGPRRSNSANFALSFQPSSGDSDGESSGSDDSGESASSNGSQKGLRSRISNRKMLDQSSRTTRPLLLEDSGEMQTNRAITKLLTNVLYTISNSTSVHNRMKSHPQLFQLRPSSLCLSTLHAVVNVDSSRSLSPRSSQLSQINAPALFSSILSLLLEDNAVCSIIDHTVMTPKPSVTQDTLQPSASSPQIRHAASESLLRPRTSSSSSSLFVPAALMATTPGQRLIHLEKRALSLVDAGSHVLIGVEQSMLVAFSYFAMACRSTFQSASASPTTSNPSHNLHVYIRDDDEDDDSGSEDEGSSGGDGDHSGSTANRVARIKITVSECATSQFGRMPRKSDASMEEVPEDDDFLEDDLDDLLLSGSESKPMYISVPPIATTVMKHCEKYVPGVKMRLTCQRFSSAADKDTEAAGGASKSHMALNLRISAGWWAPLTSVNNIAQPSSFTHVASKSASSSIKRNGSSKREDGEKKDKLKEKSRHGSSSRSHRRGSLHNSTGSEVPAAPVSAVAEFAGAFITTSSLPEASPAPLSSIAVAGGEQIPVVPPVVENAAS